MSYTDVFGGNLIFPSRVSYLALTTAIDVALQWPTEQQITGQDVVADIIDVDATAPGLNIDMPDAQIASTGNKVTFNNVGANAYLVRDITGGTIQTVQPGEQWVLSLTNNLTHAGLWTTFQLGAQVAVASASALAGAGIKAIGVLLNQKIDSDVQAATPFTLVDGDRASCQIYTAGAGICNLPAAGTVGNDWFVMIRNSGSGTLAIVPMAGLIDGSPNINLDPNGSTFIFTDGVNWFTVGLTVASTIAFDFVSIPVPGSGDFVLSGANLNRISYRFTGALTGNRRIVVPNTTQQYWVDNQTSGAFTLSISTVAQAGPPSVNPGDTVIFYCDATDVINAVNTAAIALPVLISQGGTSATTAPNALLNLGAAASALVLTAGDGLVGGGDLTAPRAFAFDLASITVGVPDLAADFFVFQDTDAADVNRKALLSSLGITIEEEGAPLATVASTLNFVGAGVVASGGGATKTITIDLVPVSGAASRLLRGDGAGGWVDAGANILIDSIGRLNTLQVMFADGPVQFRVNASDFSAISSFGTNTSISASGAITDLRLAGYDLVEIDGGNLKMFQIAAPQALELGYGQIWLESTPDQLLQFRDEADVDWAIGTTSGSFTGTLTGVSGGPVTGPIKWTRTRVNDGDDIIMLTSVGLIGTSNSTQFSMTGVPAALRPTTVVNGACFCRNESKFTNALAKLEPSGTIDFYAPDNTGNTTNPFWAFAVWGNTGSKGLEEGWTFTYRLN